MIAPLLHRLESAQRAPLSTASIVQGPPNSKQLTGYNHNFQHGGAVYHVQTEDTGAARGYVVTHLFAEGGWVIGTVKTDYRDKLHRARWRREVHELMKEQHKAMIVGLRDGEFDEIIAAGPATGRTAVDESTEASHEVSEGKVRRTTPPPPLASAPNRSHFAGLTLLLDKLATGVGAAVVDVSSRIAVSLRDEPCAPDAAERVVALLEAGPEGQGDDAWTQLIVISGDVAFAVLRREGFVLFLDTKLQGRLGAQRFRVQVRQVEEFLSGASGGGEG